ncbi:MAG: GTPase Era [Fimbriimonadaceae bacterium]|nr:GTPase Era [Fimbriimonadaceae bacterium]
MSFRAGIVAVVGRPNVGKSTLINHVVGQKVSIVSEKPQTTRRKVLGIATEEDWQIVFVDTPGVHTAAGRFGRVLNEQAREALSDVDLVLVMVDVSRAPHKEDQAVAAMLQTTGYLNGPRPAATITNDDEEEDSVPVLPFAPSQRGVPVVLCLNKMDLLKPENVERHYRAYQDLFRTDQIMMTSLQKVANIDLLVMILLNHLEEREAIFPEDEFTDQPMRLMAAELVREKVLELTQREVPHAVAVMVDSWEEEPGLTTISAVITVERESQKAILIGKGGAMLKNIGTGARLEIEKLIDQKVYLELVVRVREGWKASENILRDLDLL